MLCYVFSAAVHPVWLLEPGVFSRCMPLAPVRLAVCLVWLCLGIRFGIRLPPTMEVFPLFNRFIQTFCVKQTTD